MLDSCYKYPIVGGLLVTAVLFSLSIGGYPIPIRTVIQILFAQVFSINKSWTSDEELILLTIRLPRVLLAAVVGANLAVSGAVLQAIFRNPLVSPFTLGISSAASFGASLIMVIFQIYNIYSIQTAAFVFASLAVATV